MYFQGCTTPEAVKKEYRELAFRHHPDRGGDTRTMQDINLAYHEALKNLNGYFSQGSDGRHHTYYYQQSREQALINKIDELLRLNMAEVDIFLVGSWLWISGNTKAYRRQLGKEGMQCRWHGQRQMWYWHGARRRQQHTTGDFASICAKYGAEVIAREEDPPSINAA